MIASENSSGKIRDRFSFFNWILIFYFQADFDLKFLSRVWLKNCRSLSCYHRNPFEKMKTDLGNFLQSDLD